MSFYSLSESEEHYTPTEVWIPAEEVLDGFTLDPCSNPEPFNIPAEFHYTKSDDGLSLPWKEKVFLNPPYSRIKEEGAEPWLAKLRYEIFIGNVKEAVILTPNATSASWFVLVADLAHCLPDHRLKHLSPEGEQGSATFSSCVSYYGPNPDKFKEAYSDLGFVHNGYVFDLKQRAKFDLIMMKYYPEVYWDKAKEISEADCKLMYQYNDRVGLEIKDRLSLAFVKLFEAAVEIQEKKIDIPQEKLEWFASLLETKQASLDFEQTIGGNETPTYTMKAEASLQYGLPEKLTGFIK